MAEPFPLGGTEYEHVTVSTLEHDIWFTARLRKVGFADPQIHEGESPEDFGQRLLAQLLASGESHMIVGGLITPVGVAWTPKVAQETAAALGQIVDPDEKEKFWSFLLELLGDFFQNGLGAWMSSQGFSSVRTRDVGARKTGRTRGTRRGAPSFGNSRGTTTTARK